MKKRNKIRLSPKELSHFSKDSWMPFQTTAEIEPFKGMFGQERAMRAVEVGLNISTRGFNIFALGDPGSGKTSTLERLLKERAAKEPAPKDLCYVYDFQKPDRPRPIMLPAGMGRELAKEMDRVVSELERMVPRALSDGAFGHIRAGIVADGRRKAEELIHRASQAAYRLELRLEEGENEFKVVPLLKGEPLDREAFEKLPATRRRSIERRMLAFHEQMDSISYLRRQVERDNYDRLLAAEMRAITPLVEGLIGEVETRYRRFEGGVSEFLSDVKDHILNNHRTFMPAEDAAEEDDGEPPATDSRVMYQVNVVVDRRGQEGSPVVVERMPTASNLFGYFEYRDSQGALATDHTMIRQGALHAANGGYLMIQVADLLSQEGAWEGLKRSLRHKEIRVDEGVGAGDNRPRLAGTLKPGSVPLAVKVILVGNTELYYLLRSEDEDFGRLFKIAADFESSMERTRENEMKLARFLGQVCREEGYLPIHRSGMARLFEFASRRAEHKDLMTTRHAELLDLLSEANFFARQAKAKAIRDCDMDKALAEARRRHGAMADEIAREIREGTILIRTRGSVVGQINGIALYDLVGISFGVPVRITARLYAGRRGVINIDREVSLSGAIHDKGALILVGYLGGRYAQEHPLSLSASITFEQSYDEIDGDSASCAELYTLLSALSDCPIRQGIAVTGSVNQLGEVQPIGGVNEKIEGIFKICKSRGLTGNEGVMIPRVNVKNLILDREVIDAVRDRKFNIYAVSTVDEGIETLTGVPAGSRLRGGGWTPGSINDRVQKRMKELQKIVRGDLAHGVLEKNL